MKAPKRVYATFSKDEYTVWYDHPQSFATTEYLRADLVEELIEASRKLCLADEAKHLQGILSAIGRIRKTLSTINEE